MTAPLPEQAVTAAMSAVGKKYGAIVTETELRADVLLVLEAAAPAIRGHAAQAERERAETLITQAQDYASAESGRAEQALTLASHVLDKCYVWLDHPETYQDQIDDFARILTQLEDSAGEPSGHAGRLAELEALAADMLSRFVKTDDGHRARVGQVQIGKWEAILEGQSS